MHHGDVGLQERPTLAERLWRSFDRNGPTSAHRPDLGRCWQWTAGRNGAGYGALYTADAGRVTLAHRVAYELLVEPIPPGLTIDHLCMNRLCINPMHMEPVTVQENTRREMEYHKQFGRYASKQT